MVLYRRVVKNFAILAFIGAVGAGAALLAKRETVIDGKVMEADLLAELGKKGITAVECDPAIPIDANGATFRCKIAGSDGSTAVIGFTMDRGAKYTTEVIEQSAGPAQETVERVPPSGDPWNN